jgi:hypothetical protein
MYCDEFMSFNKSDPPAICTVFPYVGMCAVVCLALPCHACSITQGQSKNEEFSCNYVRDEMFHQTLLYFSHCLSHCSFFTITKHWKYESTFWIWCPVYRKFSCLRMQFLCHYQSVQYMLFLELGFVLLDWFTLALKSDWIRYVSQYTVPM